MKRTARSLGSKFAGFTLVELLLVILLLGVMSFSIVNFVKPIMDFTLMKNDFEGPVREAKYAIARMAREINQIRDPASVLVANSSQVSFVDVNGNTIAYALVGNELKRNNIVLARSVNALTLSYWGTNGAVLDPPTISPETNIARIQVQVSVTAVHGTVTLRTQVRPRNLYY
ncbi:MAG: prepilin-type N-terminal cleavage/methylation domain-containing protein [Candidatus Omnitrophota bacterium]